MSKCKLCQSDFTPKHFNNFLCSEECRVAARNLAKTKYKRSHKGLSAVRRLYGSAAKLATDLRYRKSEKGRRKAVERAARIIRTDPHVLFRKRLGQTAPYRKLRNALIKEFKCCQFCRSETDLTIDHKIPMRLGGKHEIGNIQLLCRSCNARKGLYAVP